MTLVGHTTMIHRTVFSSFPNVLVILSAIALAGCEPTTAQQETPPRPVLVAAVHYGAQVADRSFVGTIKPRIESDLGFRVTGKVAKRLVEVGMRVEAGQALAVLDQADLNLQAEQAKAELSAATGNMAQAGAAETRSKELRQRAGRRTRNSIRRKPPPTKRARGSTAPNDRST